MNKNSTHNNTLRFNTKYDDLAVAVKLVQKELKKNMPFIRNFAKKADRLYRWADKNCYVDGENGIMPIDGIKNLNSKMEMLAWLSSAYTDLNDLVKSFDMNV